MKVLLLIPHTLAPDRHAAVRAGKRPQADYDALAEAVRAMPDGQADILDRSSVGKDGGRLVRLTHRLLGIDWALALLGFLRCRRYDAVLTHSESLGLPLSLLSVLLWRRPRHVTTAYYLVGKRNALWYRLLRAHDRIDRIFVLGREQYEVGRRRLGIPAERLAHLESCGYVDTTFFANLPALPVKPRQVCSTGREFRDYDTLVKAAEGLDDITVKIDPASPWSQHQSDVSSQSIPPNVEICRMPMGAVWRLYAESVAIVIPLHPNPIGAGSTTLVEAMAMGKPVIVTRSRDHGFAGRPDLIDGENIILVNPHDPADLRTAIARLVNDAELRRRIGANGRRWAEIRAGRQEWVNIFLGALGAPPGVARLSGAAEGLETVYHT